jgi:hypothetical protein
MGWLTTLGAFLGRLLAAMLPAIGRELRANNTVEQKGLDDETNATLDGDIWTAASQALSSTSAAEGDLATDEIASHASGDCYAGCDADQQRLQRDIHADD